jgi:uncharacterized protein YbbC (DUF1343 family)
MTAFQLGIDRLLSDTALRAPLRGRRVGLLGHPGSVTLELEHTLDALAACDGVQVACAFGPQHGMRGEKQDDMVESDDYVDPVHGIPVHSLYGRVRRPSPEMLEGLDVLLVDLQDLGCRVYTFLTTLCHALEECAAAGVEVWVLDRPNPAGRPVEGGVLAAGEESFVGVGPLPMRHGLTLGEAARWYAAHRGLELSLEVVTMDGYDPEAGPGFGWPLAILPWVNPSPNASSLNMARCYPGTVLLEGTLLSEGRGTTVPLEVMGAPGLDVDGLLEFLEDSAPASWLEGCRLRRCAFEPTFHKHAGAICEGLQIHATAPFYRHTRFRPYRLMALLLKGVRTLHPGLDLWKPPPYEYEAHRLPIDVINGGSSLREWVEAGEQPPEALEAALNRDEREWEQARRAFLLY